MTKPNPETAVDATRRLWRLHIALEQDLDHWAKLVFEKGNTDQLARRAYVRSLFAEMEGQVFGLKRIVLEIHEQEKKHLLPEEVFLLRELIPDLIDSGKVQTRSANLRFKPNLRFAFRKFAEILGAAYEMNVSDNGWAALDSSLTVRDRLMHPKDAPDLTVSDEELNTAGVAHIWFNNEFSALFKAVGLARDAEYKAFEKESAKKK